MAVKCSTLSETLVYTLQSHLVQRVESEHLPYRIYNDYPMIAGLRRSLSADLAIVSSSNEALVAAEFKYEPCHRRLDLLQNKLPVTVWAEIKKDTTRAVEFVKLNKTKVAYAVCVDEGNHLAKRDLSIYEEHLHWTEQLDVVDALLADASDRVTHRVNVKLAAAKAAFIQKYSEMSDELGDLIKRMVPYTGLRDEAVADCPACESVGVVEGEYWVDGDVEFDQHGEPHSWSVVKLTAEKFSCAHVD
jgi:hypothetical protein